MAGASRARSNFCSSRVDPVWRTTTAPAQIVRPVSPPSQAARSIHRNAGFKTECQLDIGERAIKLPEAAADDWKLGSPRKQLDRGGFDPLGFEIPAEAP